MEPEVTLSREEKIAAQDFIIFTQPLHLDYCRRQFSYRSKNHLVWNIPDMPSDYWALPFFQGHIEALVHSHNTYMEIKSLLPQLFQYLTFSLAS